LLESHGVKESGVCPSTDDRPSTEHFQVPYDRESIVSGDEDNKGIEQDQRPKGEYFQLEDPTSNNNWTLIERRGRRKQGRKSK
ncbi:MAG: hypothetical protein ACRDL7_15060, partial [Gaiellaceae bacterium]